MGVKMEEKLKVGDRVEGPLGDGTIVRGTIEGFYTINYTRHTAGIRLFPGSIFKTGYDFYLINLDNLKLLPPICACGCGARELYG